MTFTTENPATNTPPTETDVLLATLADHRQFLLTTVDGMSDEQARLSPTASALTLGGLVKHVAATEKSWVEFILHGAPEEENWNAVDWHALRSGQDTEVPAWLVLRQQEFALLPDETLAGVLEDYRAVAARTEQVVRGLDDLSVCQLVKPAPWDPGGPKSAREVLAHLIGETAQHAGHADIIRETIDGARTMG